MSHIQAHYLSHKSTGYFSTIVHHYLAANSNLSPFYEYPCELASFEKVIQEAAQYSYPRKQLVAALQFQYGNLSTSVKVQENIAKLAHKNTFVIVTAHQNNLFSGPLYVIYKIVSAIKLAEQLQAAYPQYNFVPLYYMGSEDHDFAEINHINLFKQRVSWEQDQAGATGKIPTQSLSSTLEHVYDLLGTSDNALKMRQMLTAAYGQKATLAQATQQFINTLFAAYGLVVLDADVKAFKEDFLAIMQEELLTQVTKRLVQDTNTALAQSNYHAQAHARDINLFYMYDGFRERIVYNADTARYAVLNSDISFTKASLLETLQKHPQRFSPNVLLRPLYQQKILPNLAYIGGGGELAYWMQLKSTFAHYQVHFPMLLLRNSALWIKRTQAKKMQQLQLNISDIFLPAAGLIKKYVQQSSKNTLALTPQKLQIDKAFEAILSQANEVDQSLKQAVKGEWAKVQKSLNRLETKLLRAEKRQYDTIIQQIEKLKLQLFPANKLQERHDNLLAFYTSYGDNFISTLYQHFNPLDKRFLVLMEEV